MFRDLEANACFRWPRGHRGQEVPLPAGREDPVHWGTRQHEACRRR